MATSAQSQFPPSCQTQPSRRVGGGRGAHPRLAAKQRFRAAPRDNPATVARAKIKQREWETDSRDLRCLGGFLASQPPELMLNGVSRGAEFGGDPAEPETLRSQDQQPLNRDGGPRKPGH